MLGTIPGSRSYASPFEKFHRSVVVLKFQLGEKRERKKREREREKARAHEGAKRLGPSGKVNSRNYLLHKNEISTGWS